MKDLLVLVDTGSGTQARLEAAMGLAAAFSAHVTALGLVAEPYLRGTGRHHLPADLIRDLVAGAEAELAPVLKAAEELAAARGVNLEVRREIGSVDRLPSIVAHHARRSDLTIVPLPDPQGHGADDALLAEAAFMDSGRAALIVPAGSTATMPPRRALLAWDGSREAARAVGDALPLLRPADAVIVLVVGGHDASSETGAAPGLGIAAHLSRHGIRAEVRNVTASGMSVADTIQGQATADGADLIVMGGYGHSRLREMMLGGTTRHLLHHSSLPLLLAH
jgi:nucleotide-binding universal stress UspA family protein